MKQLVFRLVDGINAKLYRSLYDRRPVHLDDKLEDKLGNRLDYSLRSKIDGRRRQKVWEL